MNLVAGVVSFALLSIDYTGDRCDATRRDAMRTEPSRSRSLRRLPAAAVVVVRRRLRALRAGVRSPSSARSAADWPPPRRTDITPLARCPCAFRAISARFPRIGSRRGRYALRFKLYDYSSSTGKYTDSGIFADSAYFSVTLGDPKELRVTTTPSGAWAGGQAFTRQPELQVVWRSASRVARRC